jgi:hypothetical protein
MLSRFFVPSLNGELDQLGIGILEGLNPLHNDAGITGTVPVSALLVWERERKNPFILCQKDIYIYKF